MFCQGIDIQGVVASRADAWIETGFSGGAQGVRGVASRADAWIETSQTSLRQRWGTCRVPRGRVD